jgi:hypothetical protein
MPNGFVVQAIWKSQPRTWGAMARVLTTDKQEVNQPGLLLEKARSLGFTETPGRGTVPLKGKLVASTSVPASTLTVPAWRPSGKVRDESETSRATASTVVDNPVFVEAACEGSNVQEVLNTMSPPVAREHS